MSIANMHEVVQRRSSVSLYMSNREMAVKRVAIICRQTIYCEVCKIFMSLIGIQKLIIVPCENKLPHLPPPPPPQPQRQLKTVLLCCTMENNDHSLPSKFCFNEAILPLPPTTFFVFSKIYIRP